jgi:arylsulfatase A-like enzyme
MIRLLTSLISLLLLGCSSSSSPVNSAPAPRRPNIVLIVADDLGWADLGVYGNPFFESPHLDRLAADGIRFTQAYAAGHVCSPTRASILTGRYPARVGLTNYLYGTKTVDDSPVLPAPFADRLPLEEITIAERLKKAGYRTGLVGKWHLGENTSLGESDPDLQGFDVTESWDYGLLYTDRGYEWFHTGDSTNAYRLPALTEEITAGAENFIEAQRDTNFFLMVTHYAVHLPLQGDSALVAKYERKANPRPDDYHPVYAAMIEQMDASVGRIRKALDEQGLSDNTVIIFVSDNGGLAIGEAGDKPTVNDPLRAGKGTMYEGGIRVPLIAYWPERWTGGQVIPEVVNTVDLLPTVLALTGTEAKANRTIDGRNMLSAFDGEPSPVEGRDLYWHYPHFSNQGGRPRSAIRRGDLKLIESLEDGSVQLFDLARDPGETADLANQRPEMVDELRTALVEWRDEVGARLPVPKI